MIKQTTHCDVCGEQMSYRDADGRSNNKGFTLIDASDSPLALKWSHHSRHNCGYTSKPVEPLKLPEHVCSTRCLKSQIRPGTSSVERS